MSTQVKVLEVMDRGGEAVVEKPTAVSRASSAQHWAGEEALRLVQQIFPPHEPNRPRLVVFGGVDVGVGCSGICAAAATTLASRGDGAVCVVDGNLRSPSLPELFSVPTGKGLAESLQGDGPIEDYLTPVSSQNLQLLRAGVRTTERTGLLGTGRLEERIHELRAKFAYVLIDVPALSLHEDGLLLGQQSDGIVLVLEAGMTRRQVAVSLVAQLRTSGTPILGAVLNKRDFPIPSGIYKRL